MATGVCALNVVPRLVLGAHIFNKQLMLTALHSDLDGTICCTHLSDLLGLTYLCFGMLSIELP